MFVALAKIGGLLPFELDLFRNPFTRLRRADHLSDAHQKHLDRHCYEGSTLATPASRSKSRS